MSTKAKWYHHVAAFFDPNVAVNSEGELVEANGLFDSGNNGNAPLSDEAANSWSEKYTTQPTGDIKSSSSPDKSISEDVSDRIVESNQSSANKAADAANQQTGSWLRDVMNYNAAEAEKDRLFQQSSADKAMNFEAQEAQKLRDWQEMLSNTQYQRAVADLKKAGLNPILVAQHLSGASTPSGSSASGSSASGSRASASQSSATKAEVDLNSRARLIEAYLQKETSLKTTEIQSLSNLFSALIGLAK